MKVYFKVSQDIFQALVARRFFDETVKDLLDIFINVGSCGGCVSSSNVIRTRPGLSGDDAGRGADLERVASRKTDLTNVLGFLV